VKVWQRSQVDYSKARLLASESSRLAIMLGMQDIIDRLTEAKKRIQALLERL
jgi:hypothetical protein